MAYTNISKDKIHSVLQENLTTFLKKVTDPTAAEKRKYVYQRQPDTASLGEGDFPYIVLESYQAQDDSVTINGNTVSFIGSAEIHVEAEDDAGIKQKQYHDQMSDDIISMWLGSERYSLGKAQITPLPNNAVGRNTRQTAVLEDGKPLVRREIELNFRFQIDMGG